MMIDIHWEMITKIINISQSDGDNWTSEFMQLVSSWAPWCDSRAALKGGAGEAFPKMWYLNWALKDEEAWISLVKGMVIIHREKEQHFQSP